MYTLYLLKSTLDKRVYIGITKNVITRYKAHLRYTIKKSHYNGYWIKKTLERGGHIKMDILLSDLSVKQAESLEINTISIFRKLGIDITNTAPGGLGFNRTGIPHSDEHKKNLSLAQPHKVRIPKNILIDLYINKKLSKKTISNMYNCGITTIDRRLKEYNITIRKTKNYNIGKVLNVDDITNLHLVDKMSILKISKIYGVSAATIKYLFDREGIDIMVHGTHNIRKKRKYSDKLIHSIEEMVADGLSLDMISKETKLSKSKLSYIKTRYLND